jgi:hypothetical protein
MIKNKHKTLHTYGVKRLLCEIINKKRKKQLRSEFLEFYWVICALDGGAGRNFDNFCKLYILFMFVRFITKFHHIGFVAGKFLIDYLIAYF